MSCKEEKKPISWYFGCRLTFEFLCHASHATYIIRQRRYINWNINLARMWQSTFNVTIETPNKIIYKQCKSAMLDYFANCSDLCQLMVATSRRTMYISQSLSSKFCRTLHDKTKDYVDRNTVGLVYSLHEVTELEQYSQWFSSSLKSQLILPLRLRRRDSEKMLPQDKELLCLWRILFICCLFASKPRNLHIMAPTINTFLVQRWVRPFLLSLLNLPTPTNTSLSILTTLFAI